MIIYVWGNLTADNFTPRPDKDTVGALGQKPGLSASTTIPSGTKAQAIDTELLSVPLRAIPDDPNQGGTEGHVAIVPADEGGNVDVNLLNEWASFRKSGRTHTLTQQLLDAVIDANIKGAP